jgi:hypothetical protein
MNRIRRMALGAASLALPLIALGCGDRPAVWSSSTSVQAYGLADAVILVDAPAHRAVAVTAGADQMLTSTRLPTGRDVLATAVEATGKHLYLLSAGHRGGLGDTQPDEAPRLTIIEGATQTARAIDLGDVLSDPLDGLAIDPTGHWAVLYAGAGAGTAFVANPNELVVVDLTPSTTTKPVTVTLHSFGGRPEKLIFAPPLALPTGPAHLLVVQSAQDLALVSLEHPTTPEITVRLADATAVRRPHPAEIVIDDGDPARMDDARLGIRFDGDNNVMTLQLEAAAGPNGYAPTVNVADVGGVPSAIAFVRTDGGLRLAALVPARGRAVLVDPVTTITSEVMLPAAYRSLSLVTAAAGVAGTAGAGAPPGADIALLWNTGVAQTGVAFWELGQAAGRPFRSIETVGIDAMVDGVLDVPAKDPALAALKVLRTAQAGAFYVLNLADRTAAPLLTASAQVGLFVSPTGKRVWTFVPGGIGLATTDLVTKHVRTLQLDTPASDIFEIARSDGGRALVVLHGNLGAGVGATVFDADMPDDSTRRIYGALLTEGPYDDQ